MLFPFLSKRGNNCTVKDVRSHLTDCMRYANNVKILNFANYAFRTPIKRASFSLTKQLDLM